MPVLLERADGTSRMGAAILVFSSRSRPTTQRCAVGRCLLRDVKAIREDVRLAGEQGLTGLSMRRLAADVGVEAMSLYNHVANKGDLLDGMAARVFEGIPLPDPALPWDDRLRALGTAAFKSLTVHPVVVRAI